MMYCLHDFLLFLLDSERASDGMGLKRAMCEMQCLHLKFVGRRMLTLRQGVQYTNCPDVLEEAA